MLYFIGLFDGHKSHKNKKGKRRGIWPGHFIGLLIDELAIYKKARFSSEKGVSHTKILQ